ncbi:MAG: histidine phosphatase family protein [Christensenellales bacterium]|jgi:alpha-ribazole phosphatase
MLKLELTLVRHGKVEPLNLGICYGWTDMSLNATGRGEAQKAGAFLADKEFDAVYVSPFKRTWETAWEILEQNPAMRDRKRITTMEELREYYFGCWEGISYESIVQKYPELWQSYLDGNREFSAPGGETIEGFTRRVCRGVDTILEKHSEGKILVVTHYGCISTIIPYLLELENCLGWRFRVQTGGVCTIEIEDGFARLSRLGI